MQTYFNLNNVHPSWLDIIHRALRTVSLDYITDLKKDSQWLPGADAIFNAFSLPLHNTRYILFGESPYPRIESANGYAFWDNAVEKLWSPTGFSTRLNRATSLRNFVKMLLIGKGLLTPADTSQPAIAHIDKSSLIETNHELFNHLLNAGFLLLNASLVFRPGLVKVDAKQWLGFINEVLTSLQQARPDLTLVLLGKIAYQINQLPGAQGMKTFITEHPYNLSFVINPDIIDFFAPFQLLDKR